MAVITCEPLAEETKSKFAEPFESASAELTVAPSTRMFKVPVGVVALEIEPEATVRVTASFTPTVGAFVAAESEVLDAFSDEPVCAGHAVSSLSKLMEPRPEARS
jgi:hypothetical protein